MVLMALTLTAAHVWIKDSTHGGGCKVKPQDHENFDEEIKSLVSAWWKVKWESKIPHLPFTGRYQDWSLHKFSLSGLPPIILTESKELSGGALDNEELRSSHLSWALPFNVWDEQVEVPGWLCCFLEAQSESEKANNQPRNFHWCSSQT